MPILSRRHKIAYFPIPKAACTSLKMAMFSVEHDRSFTPSKGKKSVHKVLPRAGFTPGDFDDLEGFWKFAVVRDPASRIISAYNNRIVIWTKKIARMLENPAERERLLDDGILPHQPTLIEFCLRLEPYRRALKTIRLHTDPSQVFMGPDLAAYDRIYPIEELAQFEADMSQRLGRPFALPHSNKSGTVDLTMNEASTDALQRFTAPEYAYPAPFYPRASAPISASPAKP
jgi:hypothetical protein